MNNETRPNSHDPLTMIFDNISNFLLSCTKENPPFPPTEIFNEGWLLRLIIHWLSNHPESDLPISFSAGSRWYSEALLPSTFLPRIRGDKLGESRTHADGVIGHFEIGKKRKADLELSSNAKQFLVLEAKIFSSLSPGVKNAEYFDQAARNIACMAEVLHRAGRSPSEMNSLGFYVIAPKSRIDKGIFSDEIRRETVFQKVERRVSEYQSEKDVWFTQWFEPVWRKIEIQCLSWEDIISKTSLQDTEFSMGITEFYKYCLRFN